MIEIKNKRKDFLEICINDLKNKRCRFPNQMIWDINTYLSNHFKLYEYYFAKKPCNNYCLFLSKFNLNSKYLCFLDLNPSYITLVDFDEDEYKEEYEKHLCEFDNYEQFFECYSMEEITEISYIAASDFNKYIDVLSSKLSDILFKRQRLISKIVDSYSDVAVHIGDHCYMTISSNHPEIIGDLLKIIESYRKR